MKRVVVLRRGARPRRCDRRGAASASPRRPRRRQEVGRRRRLGPTTKLAFDTTEGTWMNVDVSPDGKRIVFDLLGDIYIDADRRQRRVAGDAHRRAVRPSTCSRASAPTASASPSRSDRDGLWNIWTMDADGKDAKQISREKRWFINSPTWSPDGDYIYARRHFVKERSLGAGEIWMYHAAGAVRRPAGDRAQRLAEGRRRAGRLSRRPLPLLQQGRHAGARPSNTTRIRTARSTRSCGATSSTGRERRAVSVQGGSVAPQVSPDGKTLAYVRRVRLQSVLYPARPRDRPRSRALRQRRQGPAGSLGDPRPLSAVRVDARRQVDRDLGRRQDLAGRRRVRQGARRFRSPPASSRRSTTPCASRRRSTPTSSRCACCATSASSPDGKTVVYSALGQLYVKPLPDGQPRRLTKDDRLRVLPVVLARRPVDRLHDLDRRRAGPRPRRPAGRLGGPRRRHAGPGTTSSRRSRPTARRSCSGTPAAIRSRGPFFGDDAGIYVVPAAGGEPLLVRDGGADAGVRSHRHAHLRPRGPQREVHAAQRRRAGRRASPLPGRDEIEHVRSDNATQFALVARRQVDRVRGALQDLRRAVPAHRPSGRHRSGDAGLSGAARLARRRLLPALVGRQPPRLLGARPGAVHARPRATRSPSSSGGAAEGRTSRRRRASRSASRRRRTSRRARSRSSARASSPWPA